MQSFPSTHHFLIVMEGVHVETREGGMGGAGQGQKIWSAGATVNHRMVCV